MGPIKIAIVGLGKIARDRHVPALTQDRAFELLASASPEGHLPGVRNFPDLETLLDELPELEAVAVCTPPQVRYQLALQALEHGCHVLLEKPPAVSVTECHALLALAQERQLALYATWHSRQAAGVEAARQWLQKRRIRRARVQWKEDVRVWHPGQAWIWRAGGLGVFDPGINALSILTHIMPDPLRFRDAELAFPANRETPIAAKLALDTQRGAEVSVELDFLHPGSALWDIEIETDDGRLLLSKGGAVLEINRQPAVHGADVEYAKLYAHFRQLVSRRRTDVDLAPLELVAVAFRSGRRVSVAPFVE